MSSTSQTMPSPRLWGIRALDVLAFGCLPIGVMSRTGAFGLL